MQMPQFDILNKMVFLIGHNVHWPVWGIYLWLTATTIYMNFGPEKESQN